VFYHPSRGVYRGRDEIDRIAGAIRATHPEVDFGSKKRNHAVDNSQLKAHKGELTVA
jgi:hypothetical protein